MVTPRYFTLDTNLEGCLVVEATRRAVEALLATLPKGPRRHAIRMLAVPRDALKRWFTTADGGALWWGRHGVDDPSCILLGEWCDMSEEGRRMLLD